MPEWLTDHPTLVDILLIAGGMAAGFACWRTRRKAWLGGSLAAIVVLIGIWLLGWLMPSEASKIERALQEMSAGVSTKDLNRIFNQVSSTFQQGHPTFAADLNRSAFRKAAEQALQAYKVREVVVWGLEIESISTTERKARVFFYAKPKGERTGEIAYIVRAVFVLDPDDNWRLQGFTVHNPVVDTREPMRIPLP